MGKRNSSGSRTALENLETRQLLASVVGLTLIDAQTDQPVPGFALTDGVTIDLATTSRQLNIRADVDASPVGSVRFNLDGNPTYKIESVAPFAIGGDTNNGHDYLPWTPTLGTHTLVVTPYTASAGNGTRGGGKTLTFQVIDSNPAVSPASTIRINAGGGAYTTAAHNLFAADSGFTGGAKSSSVFPVSGTIDDPLYQTRRYGAKFSFSKPVDNGTYTLMLHFVEPTFTKTNQRKFDVSAEGKLIIDDLDLVKAGVAKSAIVKSFPITIADGKIDLSFTSSINNAIVSAIELVPTGAAPQHIAVPAPIFIDAGASTATTDTIGRTFEGDAGFTGGAASAASGDVLGTDDDALFNSVHSGASFTFSRAVANGNYTLWLEFADATSTAAGQRTFDAFAEGGQILDDFDIFASAGGVAQTAVVKRFDVNIADGKIDLAFQGVAGDATVSAIVLAPTDIPQAMLWSSGIGDYADPTLHNAVVTSWKIRSASNLLQIGQGLLLYSNEHKGNYPADLKTLALNEDVEFSAYADPRIPTLQPRAVLSTLEMAAWVEKQTDYLYVGAGLKNTVPGTVYLAYENPDTTPGDTLNVLFGDGHVGEVARADVVAKFGGASVSPTSLPRPLNLAGDAKISASASNLRAIAQAMQLYSNDFKGTLPPDFGTLYLTSKPVLSPGQFINPRGVTPAPPANMTDDETVAWINASTDYVFAAAGQKLYKARILAYENPAEMKDGINILFADGHVEYREMRWALQTLAAAKVPGFA
jgi:prepilin-type processing-associated H-X9-DG protein